MRYFNMSWALFIKIHNISRKECASVSVCVTDDLPLCLFIIFSHVEKKSWPAGSR